MEGDSSTGSIILIAILLLCSAYFSATETAFSTLNRIRIKSMAENGNKRAELVLRLSDRYDKLLSTILVGNNLVNIALSAVFTVLFIGMLGNKTGPTVSTVVTTVLVLVFGEISPKSLARESPEKFAMFSAPILQVLMVLLTPVNFLFAQWKKLLTRLFHGAKDPSITEQELLALVEEAEQEGAIDQEDKDLIYSVIEFNDTKAGDILTPRVDVEGIPVDAGKEEIARVFMNTGYSRIPVYEGSLDRIVGVVHLKDFYNEIWSTDRPLSEVMKPAVFVAPSMHISDLLKLLQTQKLHLAVVADEYGGTAGIVTLEDILEELVGEIWDEHDEITEEFCRLETGCYRISGDADAEEMLALFGLEDAEADGGTVSSWVAAQLGGNIPQEGEAFAYEGLSIRVSKAEHHRVVEITVTDLRQAGEGKGN